MKVAFPKFKLFFVCTILVLVGLLPVTVFAQPELAFKQGVEAFEKNDYKTAYDKFTIAIKLDNTFSEAYYYRGRVCDEVRWIKPNANDDYTAAIRFNPNHAAAFLRRAMNQNGGKTASLDDFAAAIRIKPDFAEAYYQRAVARSRSPLYWLSEIRSGRIKEEDLKYVEVGSPKKEEAIALLTEAIRAAVSDLKRAIELSPQDFYAHAYLSTLYSELGEQGKAVSALTSALGISPDSADAYYQRGLAYLQLKDPQKANQDFTAAIRLKPDDFKAYNTRVVARMSLEDFDGALADYVEALRLNPNYLLTKRESSDVQIELDRFEQMLPKFTKTARERLADAYYERSLALRYLNGRNVDSRKMSVADLTKALNLKPSHVSARYQRGLALSELGNHVEAIKDLSEVIRLQPRNAEAYYSRGLSRRGLKDNHGAIDDFSRSIELNSEFTKAFYERARTYSELGDQQRAIADFTHAISIYPEFLDAYYRRGLAQHSLSKYQSAIDDYLEVVRLANPTERISTLQATTLNPNLAAIYHRGVARLSQAQLLDVKFSFLLSESEGSAKNVFLQSAAKDFTQVITTRPEFANAYYERGRALMITRTVTYSSGSSASTNNNIQAALADFTKAIQLNPRYADPYFSRGEYFKGALKTQEAIRDLTQAVKLDPSYAKAFYALGYIHSQNYENKRADPIAAMNNYSLAIKANPKFVAAYFSRAYLLTEKTPALAVADYNEIIRLDPNNAGAYRERASIETTLKQYPQALADYTRALDLDPSEPGSNNYVVAFTYVDRAFVRYSLGDGKGAQEDYRQALIIRPCLECTSGSASVSQASKAETFLERGLALLRRGDKDGSRQNLEEAAKLFYTQGDMPKYESVKYHLSRF